MDKYFKEQTTRSISPDGELINEKVRKFYRPFKEGRGYNFKYKSINTKSYLDIPLPECFTDTEIGKTYRLSRKIYSDSNLLAKRSNSEIKPLTKQEIQEIVSLCRTKFNPFWNKVIKNKIVKPVMLGSVEFYCFNPLYFNSTTYLPLYLFIAFQDELKEHLPKWVIEKYLDMQDKPESKNEGGWNDGFKGSKNT